MKIDDITLTLFAWDGIPATQIRKAFRDHRVGRFDGVEYALVVKESKRSYRDFTGRKSLAAARRCRKRYAGDFEKFGREHGVDPDVVAASEVVARTINHEELVGN